MVLAVYDIEVLRNCFVVCIYNTRTEDRIIFEISERTNQYKELVEYFTTPGMYFVGFNSQSYDGPIVNHLINAQHKYANASYNTITSDCFSISDDIINGEGMSVAYLRNRPFFRQIDLLTMLFSKALRVSLKEMEITMCYHNVMEMNHHWSEPIAADRIDELIAYCHNDVGATSKLLSLCIEDLKLRMAIESKFDIQCLSKDGVGIGVDIFIKFICEDMGINKHELKNLVRVPPRIAVKDLILPIIEFKTDKFKDVLRWFQSINISTEEALSEVDGELTDEKKKYKKKVLLNKTIHTFALGGLHSENRPCVHVSDEHFTIRDVDVASFYPNLIIEWGIAPSYIKAPFLRVMSTIKDLRLIAKKAKIKAEDLTYKLAMNSISGHFKNQYSPFYSPESSLSMCINGQLMLAMLIEKLELAGFECIASNTDGATFKVANGREEEFNNICKDWEKLTKMVLEETIYEKMVIYAVNDYIAFKQGYSKVKDQLFFHDAKESIKLNEIPILLKAKNDKISELRETYVKEKGMFITSPRLGKGLDSLIASKALQEYFGKGTPVQDTVRNCKSIWDFVKFERVGKQFEVMWNEEPQQRTNRFYVSRSPTAAYLYKVKEELKFDKKTGTEYNSKVYQHLLKGYGVQLINRFEDKPIDEYNIDYRYYINQVNDIIRDIEPQQQTLF
jgi:hypothetical protein